MVSVSIIIPVYNVEKYIERCLQSVMSQTYQGEMECILVDDCGSDNSIIIAEKVMSGYTGPITFLIVHHNTNKGLPAARNTGIRHVSKRGGYLLFVDSDDYISESCIEKMVECIEKDNTVQMVVGNTLPEPSDERRLRIYDLKYQNLPEKLTTNEEIRKRFYDLHSPIPIFAWNKLISFDFLVRNNLFFKEGIYNEDVHWNYFVCRKLKCIAFLNDYTYMYVANPNSIMHTILERDNADSWAVVLDDFLNNVDRDYYHSEFYYCFRRFQPWYMNFAKLNSYRILYSRFLNIALNKSEFRIWALLFLMRVKLLLRYILRR